MTDDTPVPGAPSQYSELLNELTPLELGQFSRAANLSLSEFSEIDWSTLLVWHNERQIHPDLTVEDVQTMPLGDFMQLAAKISASSSGEGTGATKSEQTSVAPSSKPSQRSASSTSNQSTSSAA